MMTLDELKELDRIASSIEEMEEELEHKYNPVKSPATESIGSHGNSVSDPTEQAAMSAIQLQEKISAMKAELDSKKIIIQEWLNSIDDVNIRRSIKYRFFYRNKGKTYKWKEISQIVYPGYSEFTAKTYVYRYLKK